MAAILGNTRGVAILMIGVVGGVLVGFLVLKVLLGGGGSAPTTPVAPPVVVLSHDGGVYHVKERIYNLADPQARRYVKMSLSLQFAAADDKFEKANAEAYKTLETAFEAEFAPDADKISDALTTIVSAKSIAQVLTTDGKEQLKQEIMTRLNGMLDKDHQIVKVLFTDFVVQ